MGLGIKKSRLRQKPALGRVTHRGLRGAFPKAIKRKGSATRKITAFKIKAVRRQGQALGMG